MLISLRECGTPGEMLPSRSLKTRTAATSAVIGGRHYVRRVHRPLPLVCVGRADSLRLPLLPSGTRDSSGWAGVRGGALPQTNCRAAGAQRPAFASARDTLSASGGQG
jgi:hypothetical protein